MKVNPKEIIESGILEEYVMGILPEAEAQEITQLCAIYPEIENEVRSIETALKNSFSVPVSPNWKQGILAALEDSSKNNESQADTGKVISMHSPSQHNNNKSRKWFWAAASFAGLFLISAATNFMLLSKNQSLTEELTVTKVKLMNASEEKSVFAAKYNQAQQDFEALFSPDFKRIEMKGTPAFDNMSCVLYWNSGTGEVICSGVSYLPELNAQQQYQLWAIVDGKPQNGGMLEYGKPSRMLDAFSAQAFAVTIEPIGGSESPTLDKMVVVASVDKTI